mgnify:CR=1 FL=1
MQQHQAEVEAKAAKKTPAKDVAKSVGVVENKFSLEGLLFCRLISAGAPTATLWRTISRAAAAACEVVLVHVVQRVDQ